MTTDPNTDFPEWLPWPVLQAFNVLFHRDLMNASIHSERVRYSPATMDLGRWLMSQYGRDALDEDDPYFGLLEDSLGRMWRIELRSEWAMQEAGVPLPQAWRFPDDQ